MITVPHVHASRTRRQPGQERQPVNLPTDWKERVRALPGDSLPHVPACVREATAVAMAQSLEALVADGIDRDLEQGRTKVLLARPPKGFHLRSELEKRHKMWHNGEFEALLVRVEMQGAERLRSRGSGVQNSSAMRGRRARQLAREQAYRKGVTALTGSMATLAPADEEKWAMSSYHEAASSRAVLLEMARAHRPMKISQGLMMMPRQGLRLKEVLTPQPA